MSALPQTQPAPRLVLLLQPDAPIAPAPRARPTLLLIKSSEGAKIAHQVGYALYGGRWHKVHHDKPAPKGAPQAQHPHAAGQHAPAKHFTDDEWKKLELPAENVNAGSHNKQLAALKEMSEAGHVTGILGASYGTNTYGKKLATVANHLLKLHGSQHQVAPGQKAGEHAAVKQAPPPAPPPELEPQTGEAPAAPGALAMPQFIEGKTTSGVVAHYEKLAQKIIDHGQAGNVQVLQDMPGVGKAWEGKTPNSKKLLALHAAALAHAQGGSAPAPATEPSLAGKPAYDHIGQTSAKLKGKPAGWVVPQVKGAAEDWLAANPGAWDELSEALAAHNHSMVAAAMDLPAPDSDSEPEPAAAPKSLTGDQQAENLDALIAGKPIPHLLHPDPAPAAAPTSKLSQIPWDAQLLPDSNTNASSHNKKVAAIKAAAEAGDVAALEAMKFGTNTYGKKQALLAQTAIAALKDGAPAPAAAPVPEVPDAATAAAAQLEGIKQLAFTAGYGVFQHPSKGYLAADAKHGSLKTFANMSQAEAAAVKLTQAGLNASVGGTHPYLVHIHGKLPEMAPPQPAAPAPVAPAKATATASAVLLHHTTDGHNKSWAASLSPDGLSMKTTYGKIGGTQQTTVKHFGTQAEAADAIAKLITEKKDKGYKYVGETQHEHEAAAPDNGPKDGDTKPGADGDTLVFKDGRWRKQGGEPQPAAPQPAAQVDPIDAVAIPDFEAMSPGKWGKAYAHVAAELVARVKEHGADGLKGVVITHNGGEAFTIKLGGFNLKKIKPLTVVTPSNKQQADRWAAMHKLVTELKAAAGKPKAKPKAKPVAAAPAVPDDTPIPSMDDWVQTGGQGGSNPGGRFKDKGGQEWYCKFPQDEATARSEVLAAKLYALAGMSGQDAMLITKGGKIGIASKWVTVKKAENPTKLAAVNGAQQGFAVDAWLANWDVVGLGYDNLQIGPDGNAIRIDAGGSLEYRAQGAKKPFGTIVDEIDTLRDAKKNPQAAAIFGKMTEADITASVAKVAAIEDAAIRALVAEHGPGTLAERKALADKLIARKQDLLKKYPGAAKPKKKRLDPTKLPVDPKGLPKPHDFANWNGPGQGLSSKAHINQANLNVEHQMIGVAATGNLKELQAFHYQELDKDSGLPSGKDKPIAQHPSKHVVQFHSDLVQLLDEIANPPQALKVFRETEVGTLAAIDAAFPPKPFGTTVAKVSSNEKLGFWVALGAVANAAKFAPKKVANFTTAMVAEAKEKHAKASKLAKHFISSVQASGSYNDLFRDGKTHDHNGNDLKDVAKAALAHATERPEGTALYRWQKMSPQMLQHIMAAKDGTVFQATGPMCTSYSPTATTGFGTHRVKILYAKGAKAVESFASGAFAGEKEVTTLPNSRFVILSKKMVPDSEHGNHSGQRLELELLMLPPDLGI